MDSRILFVNGERVEIDDETAIGITMQLYDPLNINIRQFDVSNTFSIPRTFKNRRIFGFAGEVNSVSNIQYDSLNCEYHTFNTVLIKGLVYMDSVSPTRYNLIIREFPDVFNWMIGLDYSSFLSSFLYDYLATHHAVPVATSPQAFTWAKFSRFFKRESSPLVAFMARHENEGYWVTDYEQLFAGSIEQKLSGYDITDFEEGEIQEAIFYNNNKFSTNLNYICDYVKVISGYNVSFTGNGFTDEWINHCNIVLYGIFPEVDNDGNFYFAIEDVYYSGKTLYDMFATYIKLFNLVIDISYSGETVIISINKMDTIESAPIVNFSERIQNNDIEFMPKIDGSCQKNYISYESLEEGFPPNHEGKTVLSNNKNLGASKTLMKIGCYVGGTSISVLDTWKGYNFINLYKKSKEIFNIIHIPDEYPLLYPREDGSFMGRSVRMTIAVIGGTNLTRDLSLEYDGEEIIRPPAIAEFINLSERYTILDTIYNNPKTYKIKKYLTPSDIEILKRYQLYYVKQLGGSFIISKIKSYNPHTMKPTEITLVKVSDQTTGIFEGIEYWSYGYGSNEYWTLSGGVKLY